MSLYNKLKQKKKTIIENNFFRPQWYSVFINPYFINRNSLYRAVRSFAQKTKPTDNILDVGCGIKPYRNLFQTASYTGIDIKGGGHVDEQKHVDAYYDGHSIPYADNSFDIIICTQVLEHADDPEVLMKEIARVLTPQGDFFISMPFMYPEHEVPYDFRRFTQFEHRRLLDKNGLSYGKIQKTTGFFGTFAQLFVIFCFEHITFKASVLKTLLSIIIFAPIQLAGLFLDAIFRKAGPTLDYVIMSK